MHLMPVSRTEERNFTVPASVCLGRASLSLVGRAVGDCVQCLAARLANTAGVSHFCTLEMLTKWGHPTRLVTRIKECHIRASTEVDKTSMRNESEGVLSHAEVGSARSTIVRSGFF